MQAPVSKNKIDDITKSLYSETDKQKNANFKRKFVERSLMLLALIGSIAVVILYQDVFSRMQAASTPKSMIYGTWVEQNVAHYATDEFVLNERGVTVAGSVIATDFSFDGNYFEYRSAGKTFRFKMVNSDNTEMRLDSDAYYNPVFRLKGYNDHSVR
ncbi:DUF2850 domain-containing protein [Vibrio fortis]|uniref:DUF2850 domain-containing protein n=1 Tax=Vibrio fortis TaxID=212667 RepID=A0A5N3SC42_9VIBR|nr:DUF2850 domain-containing protein [Vibrio fortis]KAB0304406.1 DUF2850 domain-containing protein [Vibrio fortis]